MRILSGGAAALTAFATLNPALLPVATHQAVAAAGPVVDHSSYGC